MPSQQQTLEQERAARAWENVTGALNHAKRAVGASLEEAEKQQDRRRMEDLRKVHERLNNPEGSEKFKGRYGTLARKAPAMIMSAGMGQTMAFLRAKGKNDGWNEHNILYQQISDWVVKHLGSESKDLLYLVHQESSEVYRQATTEALAFLVWLKRFAEAELPEVTEG